MQDLMFVPDVIDESFASVSKRHDYPWWYVQHKVQETMDFSTGDVIELCDIVLDSCCKLKNEH